MPLVRIDIRKNDDPLFAKNIGEVIYRALRAAMNVPDKDNFQILNEHDAAHFIYDPAYLGIARTDGLVYIQITLNEGRTLDQKKAALQSHRRGASYGACDQERRRLHQPGRGKEGELVLRQRRRPVRQLNRVGVRRSAHG